MDLFGPSDAGFGNRAHVDRFPAMGDHGIHDLDFPVRNQHSPSHESYCFGPIDNFGDTGDVLQGGWDQFAGVVIEDKRRRSPHAKAVGGNPIRFPARCTGQSLLNQRGEHVEMTAGFIICRKAGIPQQVLNLRRRAVHTDLFKNAQRILMNRAQHLPGMRSSGHLAWFHGWSCQWAHGICRYQSTNMRPMLAVVSESSIYIPRPTRWMDAKLLSS